MPKSRKYTGIICAGPQLLRHASGRSCGLQPLAAESACSCRCPGHPSRRELARPNKRGCEDKTGKVDSKYLKSWFASELTHIVQVGFDLITH